MLGDFVLFSKLSLVSIQYDNNSYIQKSWQNLEVRYLFVYFYLVVLCDHYFFVLKENVYAVCLLVFLTPL